MKIKLFRYHWPSRRREMERVLQADPQVRPPRKCEQPELTAAEKSRLRLEIEREAKGQQ